MSSSGGQVDVENGQCYGLLIVSEQVAGLDGGGSLGRLLWVDGWLVGMHPTCSKLDARTPFATRESSRYNNHSL